MHTAHDRFTLEDFALKSMHLAKMTGVSTASHAISDAFLLMHSGVGCKYKTASQTAQHDWGEHPNTREAWTQVSEGSLIEGCAQRLGPFARAWWERRESKLMVVVSAYFIELTGDDVGAVVKGVEQTLPGCDMVYVRTAAPNDGFFDGYASVVRAVVERIDWSARVTQPRQASVMGFFFHRHEPDVKGDLGQLTQLLKASGLECGPVFLSGQGYTDLQRAPEARFVIALPYLMPERAAVLAKVGDRVVIDADLPIGLTGTARFVRTVAAAAGTPMPAVEAWIANQTRGVRAQLDRVAHRLRPLCFAVFAEAPLAAGLVSLLNDLGVRVTLVGLRDTRGCLGGAAAFTATLARDGVTLPDGAVLLEEPSLRQVKARCLAGLRSGELHGVIGSTHELGVLQRAREASDELSSAALIETGFPSDTHHAVLMQATFGFSGVAQWAQRILDTVYAPRVGTE